MRKLFAIAFAVVLTLASCASTSDQIPLRQGHARSSQDETAVSQEVFDELDELARIVDNSYCVGTTGISKPFNCLGRCHEFPTFELIKSWNTGPLLSDSCGFIALDHNEAAPRIIVAFRGTYSITNTLIDLSTVPQEYVPYPDDEDATAKQDGTPSTKCANCTVHSGFLLAWKTTRPLIMHHMELVTSGFPDYQVNLVGHSLGGAVALLAALEFHARGWEPYVTTFGEPKVGNGAFVAHVDSKLVHRPDMDQNDVTSKSLTYRRVTHINDPVPLLPLTEWGYRPHAGEIFINKHELPPSLEDLRLCKGDADEDCSADADPSLISDAQAFAILPLTATGSAPSRQGVDTEVFRRFPTRYKLWQLFFAHRDYFWRLGVCFHISEKEAQ